MDQEMKQPFRPIGWIWGLVVIALFGCGVSLPDRAQVDSGVATAQALAANAGPTLEALQTQAVALATSAAPTLGAGVEQAATVAARAQELGGNVQATLEAAGIDGNYLLAKAASLKPDENGNVNLTLTETEVNLVLQVRQLVTPEGEAQITARQTQIRFTGGRVVFTGQIRTPVEGVLSMTMIPVVRDGKVAFDIVTADFNGSQVPAFLLGSVEATLNGIINGAVDALPGGVVLKEVVVQEGSLTLVAGR